MNTFVQHTLSMRDPQAPSGQELVSAWHRYYAPEISRSMIIPVHGALGVVVNRPHAKQKILSVDMCEVVRQTHHAFASALGYDASHVGKAVWCYDGYGLEGSDQPKVTRALINMQLVQPVPDIDKIRATLQQAHKDTLIVANTSTAVGTEAATIKFLAEYLPGCFDGILFPRNYNGTGNLTKGHAIYHLMTALNTQFERASVAHIDDAPHHNVSVLGVLRQGGLSSVKATMPLFGPGENAIIRNPITIPEGVATTETIADAFVASVAFLSTDTAQNASAVSNHLTPQTAR